MRKLHLGNIICSFSFKHPEFGNIVKLFDGDDVKKFIEIILYMLPQVVTLFIVDGGGNRGKESG